MSAVDQLAIDAMRQQRDAFVGRFWQSVAGLLDVFSIYLGDRLGFYRALADHGPLTAAELAAQTGAHERYAREWLEEQTTAGILTLEARDVQPADRRFALPWAHQELLVDPDSLDYLPPQTRIFVSLTRPLDAIIAAFRSGQGVPYAAYGDDLREGLDAANRPWFQQQLGTNWLPLMPDVAARLAQAPPARVADIGCGAGWSSIAVAEVYPGAHVDGFELDVPSVTLARQHAATAGVSERVQFHVQDVVATPPVEPYDLVMSFTCLHDLPRPIEMLRAMRWMTRQGGTVLIGDPPAGDHFTGEVNPDERVLYGASILHCLPVGMSEQPSAGTGTLLRPTTMREYAQAAGFGDIEVLPITDFGRLYRLVQ